MAAIRRTVARLPSGRWRARYLDPTTKTWKGVGSHRTRGEAQRALDAAIADIDLTAPIGAEMTFEEYAERVFWPLADGAGNMLSNQRSLYRNHILPRWGNVRLGDLEPVMIKAWARAELPHQRRVNESLLAISSHTASQVYWIFHKIVGSAVENRYLTQDPLPRRSGLKTAQARKPTRILTPEQVHTLATMIEPHWRDAILTMAYGGFRIGEFFALRMNDVNFDACTIAVDEQVIELRGEGLTFTKDLKRARSQRAVPMPTSIIELVASRAFEHGLQGDDLIFRQPSGLPTRPNNWRKRVFEPAVRAAGLAPMVPHDLRHTAASAWFDEGFDLVEVARMLGDSLAVAEKTYVHIYAGRRPERMHALDARIARGASLSTNVTPLRRAR